ncbi:SDR family oxidoreductase [Candidatus Sumerlaeota bacterium]|nr:SDR family oxidoreductase [Candidatus Sumerlaeota bacterium]
MADTTFDLRGKVALVTGGNSGIGFGMAEALARAGADVCIWGTNEDKNRSAEEKLKAYGGKAVAMRCDVGDQDQVKESFAKVVEVLGRVDSCFANAGVGSSGAAFHEMSAEEWHRVFRVNMDGVFYTYQEAVKHMIDRGGGGSLVVTSSGSAIFGAPRSVHYAATKAGVLAITRALAVGYARYGIRANAIVPGWIETPMTERVIHTEPFKEKVLKRIPLRRWGTGADFGGLAVYLASDASAYHTGDVLMIDGGYASF